MGFLEISIFFLAFFFASISFFDNSPTDSERRGGRGFGLEYGLVGIN